MTPGGNILNRALRVIKPQPFSYYAFVRRVQNRIGQDVAEYSEPAVLNGSVQAPSRDLLERYGLDLQADYLVFFVAKHMLDIERDVSGDHIGFNNKRYQILSKTNWLAIDGWIQILTVQIPQPAC